MTIYALSGINYWIPLTLLVYSLLIFLITRNRYYLLYIFFIFCYQAYQLVDFGLFHHLFKFVPNHWLEHFIQLAIICCGLSYLIFSNAILQIKKYSVRLNQFMQFLIVMSIPVAVISFMFEPILKNYIPALYILLAMGVSTCGSIISLRQGYKPARYYFAGMVILILSLIVGFLVDENFITRNIFMDNIGEIGVTLDILLQGIALAVQFNLLKEEEAKMHADLIKQKEINNQQQAFAIAEQQRLIQAYHRFVPQSFLNLLKKESILSMELGDQIEKEMAILFADMRNFTSIIEKKTPKESFEFVNEYLKKLGPIVRQHGGFIDKYIGDSIMALFESPEASIKAAIMLHETVKEMNLHRDKNNQINIGISVHYGPIILGTVGEEERMDGTAISDAVNTASRLEGLNKIYGTSIIISEQLLRALPNKEQFPIHFLDQVLVKGKTNKIKIYEILNPEQLTGYAINLRTDLHKMNTQLIYADTAIAS